METMEMLRSISLDIPQKVMEYAERYAQSNRNFVSWLQALNDSVVQRIFAYRKKKGKSLEITEVIRKITENQSYLVKNLYCCGFYGYHAVFKKETRKAISRGYPYIVFGEEWFDVWEECEDGVPNIWNKVLNPEILQETRFKYSGYDTSITYNVVEYLNLYLKHPSVEFFGKMGIQPSASLVSQAEKDKAFRKWLYKNKDSVTNYGAKVTLYAYKNSLSLSRAKEICDTNARTVRYAPEIKGTPIDREKLSLYIRDKKIGWSSYNDYIKALKKLKFDLTDTKNIFPYNFKRMHDLRVAEYDSVIAKEDREKRKQLYADFAKKAQKAKPLEYQTDSFAALIPKDIDDLKREGKELNHCVGKMGYDKKMADGEIVIVFVRDIMALTKPLVTLEYSLKKHKVLQAHGDFDRNPTDTEQAFIDEWTKRTNKLLKAECVTL